MIMLLRLNFPPYESIFLSLPFPNLYDRLSGLLKFFLCVIKGVLQNSSIVRKLLIAAAARTGFTHWENGLFSATGLLNGLFDLLNLFFSQSKILILFDSKIGQNQITLDGDFRMFEDSFGAAQRASVNGHHLWNVRGRLDKAVEMAPNTGQAEHLTKAFLG